MKKKLIVLLMFLLSCLAIYSDEINNQSNSNSFSSKNFLKKLTSLTPKNPERTEKFASYLKNEMERKREVSYLIKVDKDEKKITVLAENGEILFDEAVPEEVINSFPTYQTKIKEVEEKGLMKTYVEANYMVKTVRKPNFKNEKVEEPEKKEKTELSKLEDNIKLLLKSYDVLKSKIKNLLPDGEIKLFHPNGKVSGMATANEGKLDGVARLFDENGNTIEEVIYKNNKVVKRIK